MARWLRPVIEGLLGVLLVVVAAVGRVPAAAAGAMYVGAGAVLTDAILVFQTRWRERLPSAVDIRREQLEEERDRYQQDRQPIERLLGGDGVEGRQAREQFDTMPYTKH